MSDKPNNLELPLAAKESNNLELPLEAKEFNQKVRNVSLAFNLDLEISESLLIFAERTQDMMEQANGKLDKQDREAFNADLQEIIGVDVNGILAVKKDEQLKQELIEKAAKKLETSPTNFEKNILPKILVQI